MNNKFEIIQRKINHRANMIDACLLLVQDEQLPETTVNLILKEAESYAQECVALVQLAKEYYKESLIEKTQSNESIN